MADRPPRVDLYCEDLGHELFVRALLRRLAREEGIRISLRTRNGRGGHGRAISEFTAWQRTVSRQQAAGRPALLILVIDGNCRTWGEAHKTLTKEVDSAVFPSFVVGCPDPHIERWCLADPVAFGKVVGISPMADPGKCERDLYKTHLRQSISRGGQAILTDAMEFAPDLVAAMDFYRAGKNQRSLRLFIEELKKSLRTLAALRSAHARHP